MNNKEFDTLQRIEEIDRATHELLSDSEVMANSLWLVMDDGSMTGQELSMSMQEGYAELVSILYQCDDIFADLFNGKTLEEIGKFRSLRPFRILENIRKSSQPLVQECINNMLADKFGGGE